MTKSNDGYFRLYDAGGRPQGEVTVLHDRCVGWSASLRALRGVSQKDIQQFCREEGWRMEAVRPPWEKHGSAASDD